MTEGQRRAGTGVGTAEARLAEARRELVAVENLVYKARGAYLAATTRTIIPARRALDAALARREAASRAFAESERVFARSRLRAFAGHVRGIREGPVRHGPEVNAPVAATLILTDPTVPPDA